MITSELLAFFEERLTEITDYAELLTDVEKAARSGPPKIVGASSVISTSQQRILYSSVYLQLYNLVEATVSRCVEAVAQAAADGAWRPDDLNQEMRREWVRSSARTHVDLTPRTASLPLSRCATTSSGVSRCPPSRLSLAAAGTGMMTRSRR